MVSDRRSDRPIWFRMPGEPMKAYEAFKIYRGTLNSSDVDPVSKGGGRGAHRGIDVSGDAAWVPAQPVRDQIRVARFAQIPAGTIAFYSARYQWVERAEAYDEDVEMMVREEIRRAVRLRVSRWLKFRDAEADRIKADVDMIREKVKEMGEFTPLWQVNDTVEERYPDGRPMTINRTIEPVKWRLRDIAVMAKYANEMMEMATRLALGEVEAGRDEGAEDVIPSEDAAIMLNAYVNAKGIEYDPRSGKSDGT